MQFEIRRSGFWQWLRHYTNRSSQRVPNWRERPGSCVLSSPFCGCCHTPHCCAIGTISSPAQDKDQTKLEPLLCILLIVILPVSLSFFFLLFTIILSHTDIRVHVCIKRDFIFHVFNFDCSLTQSYHVQANLWSLVYLTFSLVLAVMLLVTLLISEGLTAESEVEFIVTSVTGLDVSLITTSTIVELGGLMVTITGHVSTISVRVKVLNKIYCYALQCAIGQKL